MVDEPGLSTPNFFRWKILRNMTLSNVLVMNTPYYMNDMGSGVETKPTELNTERKVTILAPK